MWSPPTWSAGSGSSSRLGSCRRRRRFRQVGALDLPRLVDLEDVAFLHVVEALEQDPALEALGDRASVVLEARQLRDRGLLDDRAVADAPHRRAAADIALGHVAARDRAESRDPEQGPDLDLADRLLGRDRAEHADERLLDVLGQLVDDAVGSDLDAFALGELAGLGRRPHVEADHHRVRGDGEVDVVLRDPADSLMDDADAHLGVLDLLQLADRGLDRADHVALEDEVEILGAALLHLFEQALERIGAAGLCRQLLPPEALAADLSELPRCALALDHSRVLPRRRWMVEPEDLDRGARSCLLDLFAAVVVEGAHPAPGVAGDDRVTDPEGAALNEHRRDGAAANVEARFDDRA